MAEAITFISIIIGMLLLKNLVTIFPSLVACLVRAKECINLEASVKLSRDRDLIASGMFLPFCLIAYRYDFLQKGLMEGTSDNIRLLAIIGAMLLYFLFRVAVFKLFRPQRMPKKTYETAGKAAHTFFAILTLILLVTAGISEVAGIGKDAAKGAMLWISAVTYMLFIIRKLQIFNSSCSVFTGFLYLCALEFIPTGSLVVSAIIL